MKAVHLAIDIHTSDKACGLSSKKRASFPAEIRTFATTLSHVGIGTIWTAYGTQFRHFARKTTTPSHKTWPESFTRKFGLDRVAPRLSEDIFIKSKNDAFADGSLMDILKKESVTHVIITGMHTRLCVAETALTALNRGFECIVANDLLANMKGEGAEDYDSVWHRRALESLLHAPRKNLRFLPGSLVASRLEKGLSL